MNKPILCLDFDGVIHSYSSGWKGADIITDPPVAGAMQFIRKALEHFRVAIFSSRSNQPGGLKAMQDYIAVNSEIGFHPIDGLEWPMEKPPAFVTIDDRALTFDGTWPDIEALKQFRPWNKRGFGATGTFPQGRGKKQAPTPWTFTQNSWQYTTIYDAEGHAICRLDLEDWNVTEDNQDELGSMQTQIARRIVEAVNSR